MTTSDKTKKSTRKIVLWIVIPIVTIVLLLIGTLLGYSACFAYDLHNYYVQYANTSKFEDFSSIQGDFETVAELAFEHKQKVINHEYGFLDIGIDKNGTPYLGHYIFDIELTDEEKESVSNVYNAYYNEGFSSYLNMISFINNDEDLLFWGDDGRYAMVYAPSDEPNTAEIEDYMGKDAGIVKLADCWYQVVRP